MVKKKKHIRTFKPFPPSKCFSCKEVNLYMRPVTTSELHKGHALGLLSMYQSKALAENIPDEV